MNKKHFGFLEKITQKARYPMYAYILGINGGIYLGWQGFILSQNFIKKNFMLSRENLRKGRIWTLLTHSFTHLEFFHFLSNSIGLYFFGGQIERLFGPQVFLRIFLSGAVLGGLIQACTNFYDLPMVGSSNAVSALLGFFVARYPRQKILLFPIPLPIPAWLFGLGFFYLNYRGYDRQGQIGHAGHLSGFLTGLGYHFLTK